MDPRRGPWSVLPWMCVTTGRVSSFARKQPAGTEAQGAGCGLPGRCTMNEGAMMKKAVTGLRLVHMSNQTCVREVREATTGRVVCVPRIWAVAAPVRVVERGRTQTQEESEAPFRQMKVELAFYRKYTEAMLRRYVRMSTEAGRVPSLLGREMFRGNVTSCKVKSFEDSVIFCLDVERCLGKLRREDQQLIQRIALQEYSQGEAAPLLGMGLRCCVQKYARAIDRLTEMLLDAELMEPLKSCQEGEPV